MSRIFKGMNCAGTIQNPDALFICAKAKRQQQLRQGEIDFVSKGAKKGNIEVGYYHLH